jgi:membrane-associated phospholipid phosphatase
MAGGSTSDPAVATPATPVASRGWWTGATLRFASAAVVSAALLAVTFWGFVLTEAGQRLENLALAGATFRDPSEVEGSLAGLSAISVLSFAAAIALVFLIGLARRRPGLAVLAATVMGVSILLTEVLKSVLPRPELVDGPRWLLLNSFPSGHATIAASIGIGALLVAPDKLRWLVLPLAAVYAAVIAQAVQIAGWHRLSGTVGGMLVAMVVACVSLSVLAALGQVRTTQAGRVPRAVQVGLLVISGAAVAVAAAVAGLPIVFPVLSAPAGSNSVFAHTVLGLVGVGTTVLVLVTFTALIEPFSLGTVARPESTAPDARRVASGPPGP